MFSAPSVVWLGFVASLIAGLGTGLGALAVFFLREISEKLEDGMLSFAAGVMLAASFFSLLLPAIEHGELQFDSRVFAVVVVIVGLMLGAGVLYFIHNHVPHEHFFTGHEGPDTQALSRIWLFVIAITLHNFPEGMAVGVGFAGGDVGNGLSIATGMGIQNMPEGLAVAVSLMAVNYSRTTAFWIAFLTGLVEAVGGLFGSFAVSLSAILIPWTMGFSAGAMLFIISDEIIPETHRGGFQNLATLSLLVGFSVMMFLDGTLG